ncbi:MAG: hypothetical protein M1504_00070 [Candidatus Marsarchaeota archaeon]|nr:hypothetical protein [Candidatus Marsarchaeota archaeon]
MASDGTGPSSGAKGKAAVSSPMLLIGAVVIIVIIAVAAVLVSTSSHGSTPQKTNNSTSKSTTASTTINSSKNTSQNTTKTTVNTTTSTTIPANIAPTVPSNLRYYAPITLTNENGTTPKSFQTELSLNNTLYANYTAQSLQNVEFFYANGTVIQSWLQTGNDTQGFYGKIVPVKYWITLNHQISAHGSYTIYMGFATPTYNLMNNVTDGEAGYLSRPYGKFDNGAHIFEFYDNFNGTSLGSKWSLANNGASYNIYFGLTTSSFGPTSINVYSKALFDYPAEVDWYAAPFTSTANSSTVQFGNATSVSFGSGVGESLWLGNATQIVLSYATSASKTSQTQPTYIDNGQGTGYHLYSILVKNDNVTFMFDGTPVITQQVSYMPSSQSLSAVQNTGSDSTTPNIYWVRVISNPVYLSQSYGSVK